MFAATGVTNGSMLQRRAPVARLRHDAFVVMRSKTGTVRSIEASHNFAMKPSYDHADGGRLRRTHSSAWSARSAESAGCCARATSAPPCRWPSSWASPKSSRASLPARGIDAAAAPQFLEPRLRDLLPDPSHLKDMDKAAARVAAAVRAGKLVAVFGDYDVDGATSSALLHRFITRAGGRVRVYIPDRIKRATARTPRRSSSCATREPRSSSRSIAARPRMRRWRRRQRPGSMSWSSITMPRSRSCRDAFAIVNPNRLDETGPHRPSGRGRRRVSPRRGDKPLTAAARLVRGTRRARSARAARSRRPGHGLRRRSAHRPQSRARRAGSQGHRAEAQCGAGGARRGRADRAALRGPIISASCSGRASTPAGASARPISARAC